MTLAPSPERPQVSSNYKWFVVGMLWLICFFNYADRQALSAVLPYLSRDLHFDKNQLGLIAAAFAWVYALTAPFAGQVGDRWLSRKAVILGGLTAWSAITGFTSLCSSVFQFILVRGASGLGETFYMPASLSLLSDYHGRSTRSRALSLHQTGVYAGSIGGVVLAGWIGARWGWRWAFPALAIPGVILAVVLGLCLREPERDEAERQEIGEVAAPVAPVTIIPFLMGLVSTPSALLLILGFCGANFVAMVPLAWLPLFLHEKFGLSVPAAAVYASTFLQLASMAGAALGGVMADSWRRLSPGGRMLSQAVGVLLGAPFVFMCGWAPGLTLTVVAMTMWGLFKGVYDANIWASLYDVVTPARRATAAGLTNMVGWIAGGLGAWGIGHVTQNGLSMSTAISALSSVYVVVAIMLVVAALVFAPRDVRRASAA